MTAYVFAPPPAPSVAVAGETARFPVRRIFCVGRNYAAHVREMGNDEREPPFFFCKPGDAVVDTGKAIPYPPLTANLHHEVELVVAIGKTCAGIDPGNALDSVFGYAAGIDLTRRDLQDEAKAMKRPWDWSKAFDNSALCGPLALAAAIGHPDKGRIWLTVNGDMRQDADLADMIWGVADIVAACSRAVTLKPGDLIFTGTPAGVGPLVPGDRLAGGIDGVGDIEATIAPATP
ncbi:MAG: fumarylacetoacetate hydrolase family protein [Rhizobiaceae bacterium]